MFTLVILYTLYTPICPVYPFTLVVLYTLYTSSRGETELTFFVNLINFLSGIY